MPSLEGENKITFLISITLLPCTLVLGCREVDSVVLKQGLCYNRRQNIVLEPRNVQKEICYKKEFLMIN